MASKKRPGSAKRTVAKQEAERKRTLPGKRFVGETAPQAEASRRRERKKVARMAQAARKAAPAAAARTAGASARRKPAKRPAREEAGGPARKLEEAAADFRIAEENAALAGAEIEPLDRPLATVSRLTPAGAADRARRAGADAADRAVTPDAWETTARAAPPAPEARDAIGDGGDASAPLGSALADLARSALGLARTVVTVPLRIVLAVPRLALGALLR